MFRFLMVCAVIGLSWIWIDARWQPEMRELSLRLRTGDEIRSLALERARRLGSEWVRSWAERGSAPLSGDPAVAAAPVQDGGRERVTAQERRDGENSARVKLRP